MKLFGKKKAKKEEPEEEVEQKVEPTVYAPHVKTKALILGTPMDNQMVDVQIKNNKIVYKEGELTAEWDLPSNIQPILVTEKYKRGMFGLFGGTDVYQILPVSAVQGVALTIDWDKFTIESPELAQDIFQGAAEQGVLRSLQEYSLIQAQLGAMGNMNMLLIVIVIGLAIIGAKVFGMF